MTTTDSRGVSLHLANLSKTFPSRDGEVRAVDGISLDVRPGEFVSLVGPSGCGKSTILAMVGGLMPPSSGILEIEERRVTEPLDELGIVFQRDLLLEWRTVLANVLLPVQIKKLDRQPHLKRAEELLSLVGLQDFANSYPFELSGGMRQRVALCRSLIHSPRLLLLDEPFAALDALTREQLGVDLLRIHRRYRPTVLFITHSIEEAVFLSDRVLLLSARPARILQEFRIELGPCRSADTRRSQEYLSLVASVRAALEEALQI